MYDNLYDFEALYQANRYELERRIEECRKLKSAVPGKAKLVHRASLILVLQSIRNIFK